MGGGTEANSQHRQLAQAALTPAEKRGQEEGSKFENSVYGFQLAYADAGHTIVKSELCVPKGELSGV